MKKNTSKRKNRVRNSRIAMVAAAFAGIIASITAFVKILRRKSKPKRIQPS